MAVGGFCPPGLIGLSLAKENVFFKFHGRFNCCYDENEAIYGFQSIKCTQRKVSVGAIQQKVSLGTKC